MTKIEYIVPGYGETYPENAKELGYKLPVTTPAKVAEAAAIGYGRSGWPLKFDVYFNGVSQGIFEVDRRTMPEFIARRI